MKELARSGQAERAPESGQNNRLSVIIEVVRADESLQ